MSGAYPHFKPSYMHEELVERFLLTSADLQLILACRGATNRCGMVLLLKALTYLGYVPDNRLHENKPTATIEKQQLKWTHMGVEA